MTKTPNNLTSLQNRDSSNEHITTTNITMQTTIKKKQQTLTSTVTSGKTAGHANIKQSNQTMMSKKQEMVASANINLTKFLSHNNKKT